MLARLGPVGLRSICALCIASLLLAGCAGNGGVFIEYETHDDGAACAWKTVGNVGIGTAYVLAVVTVVGGLAAIIIYVALNSGQAHDPTAAPMEKPEGVMDVP
jgi:hypothetical protein